MPLKLNVLKLGCTAEEWEKPSKITQDLLRRSMRHGGVFPAQLQRPDGSRFGAAMGEIRQGHAVQREPRVNKEFTNTPHLRAVLGFPRPPP